MTTIEKIYSSFLLSSGVCTDTRRITKNCLFVALKGANFNGNLFAKKALEEGAFKVIVDDPGVVEGVNYFLVENSLKTLQELATYHRRKLGIPIIGITGTNGKTTTKELVSVVLSKKRKVFATKGNFNNHIGVPLTLLSMSNETKLGIVEMGANHLGEIAELCEIAEPNYGLITNVGKAHLEGFGSFEGVKRTKAELYRYIELNSGTLFLNSDNVDLNEMLGKGAALITYGHKKEEVGISILNIENTSNVRFSCVVDGNILQINSKLVGNYNLENILAAISIGNYFGVDHSDIEDAINNYVPENNRSQLVTSGDNKIIFDAYNANPTSMMAALKNFISLPDKDKVVILGEMKELGKESRKEHENIISILKDSSLLKAILVGDNYKEVLPNLPNFAWTRDVDDLLDLLKRKPLKGLFILVKGSRSNRLENLKDVL